MLQLHSSFKNYFTLIQLIQKASFVCPIEKSSEEDTAFETLPYTPISYQTLTKQKNSMTLISE